MISPARWWQEQFLLTLTRALWWELKGVFLQPTPVSTKTQKPNCALLRFCASVCACARVWASSTFVSAAVSDTRFYGRRAPVTQRQLVLFFNQQHPRVNAGRSKHTHAHVQHTRTNTVNEQRQCKYSIIYFMCRQSSLSRSSATGEVEVGNEVN